MTRPLLLIDVDGPLNPYAASNNTINKFNRQYPTRAYRQYTISGYKVRLARWHGSELTSLADSFDLVWATTWEHRANTEIGPKIGLPDLPVISFKDLPGQPPAPGLYWKTTAIADYCAERPFAWIDDEISHTDEKYITDRHSAPSKLMKIDPAIGLTPEHFTELKTWATQLKRKAPIPILTDRERKILAYKARGHTSPQIAQELHLAVNTIHNYLYKSYAKLQATNDVSACVNAILQDILTEDMIRHPENLPG